MRVKVWPIEHSIVGGDADKYIRSKIRVVRALPYLEAYLKAYLERHNIALLIAKSPISLALPDAPSHLNG